MNDDDLDQTLVKASGALLAAVDPTAGVATAILSHHLTNLSTNATWRAAAQDLWADVLISESQARQRLYDETKNEFQRHHYILGWLKDELAELVERIEHLEAIALNYMTLGESLVRVRPEPEMRPYLRVALSNSLRNRELFTPTWVRRLVPLLSELGAEHLAALVEIEQCSELSGAGPSSFARTLSVVSMLEADDGLIGQELEHLKLIDLQLGLVWPLAKMLLRLINPSHLDD